MPGLVETDPDEFGSYVNGTWTQLASTPAGYSPLYHSSAVLPDAGMYSRDFNYAASGSTADE